MRKALRRTGLSLGRSLILLGLAILPAQTVWLGLQLVSWPLIISGVCAIGLILAAGFTFAYDRQMIRLLRKQMSALANLTELRTDIETVGIERQKPKMVTFYMHPKIYDQLITAAATEGSTRTDVLNRAISQYAVMLQTPVGVGLAYKDADNKVQRWYHLAKDE